MRDLCTSNQFIRHDQEGRLYLDPFVICNEAGTFKVLACALLKGSTAAETGVALRVGAALLLCAICALTKCPAARALHKLSSPARTAAATIRASRREFSPGSVG